jgi:hypothetical protein
MTRKESVREMCRRITKRAAAEEVVQNPEIKRAARDGYTELLKYLTMTRKERKAALHRKGKGRKA